MPNCKNALYIYFLIFTTILFPFAYEKTEAQNHLVINEWFQSWRVVVRIWSEFSVSTVHTHVTTARAAFLFQLGIKVHIQRFIFLLE